MPNAEFDAGSSPPVRPTLTEIATNAIRYWELRRLLYNAVLVAIVVGYFAAYWPASRSAISVDRFLGLFLLVVLANLCYCAAYVIDIFAQLSDFRPLWLRLRWISLTVGIIFAAILARFMTLGLLESFVGD